MKKSLMASSMLAITLALTSTVTFQTAALAQETQSAKAAVTTTDADPALWVVKDEDTTIYLFGTVHLLKPGLSWFDEAVREAFNASDELVVEMIEPDEAAMQQLVISKAINLEVPLRSRLNDEEKAIYEAAMVSIGMPAAALDQFNPWFAAVTVGLLPLVKAGYETENGVDKVLIAEAKSMGKKLDQLETADEQLDFFAMLPAPSQVAYLIATAQSIDDTAAQMDAMVANWSRADIDSLALAMAEGFPDPQLYHTLLTQRNKNWAGWVKTRLDKPGTVFLAVGAGHLAGRDSLQAKLEGLNISTSRIEY